MYFSKDKRFHIEFVTGEELTFDKGMSKKGKVALTEMARIFGFN